jgi:hypothetical protein
MKISPRMKKRGTAGGQSDYPTSIDIRETSPYNEVVPPFCTTA